MNMYQTWLDEIDVSQSKSFFSDKDTKRMDIDLNKVRLCKASGADHHPTFPGIA